MQQKFEATRSSRQELAAAIVRVPTEPRAFLRWCIEHGEQLPYRLELSAGRVVAMQQRTSRWHNRITNNIRRELERQLDLDRFEVLQTDFMVEIAGGFRGPDVLVEPLKVDRNDYTSPDPIYLAEVLSPTSGARDFVEKAPEYGAIPTVQAYLVCSQDGPIAWLWSRQPDTSWPEKPREIEGREQTIRLQGIGIEFAMAGIYRGIPDLPAGA